MLPPWITAGPAKAESYAYYVQHYLDWWNFDAEDQDFSAEVQAKLQEFFDVAKYYSPFPEDRARYPGFKAEQDIDQAFADLLAVVGPT